MFGSALSSEMPGTALLPLTPSVSPTRRGDIGCDKGLPLKCPSLTHPMSLVVPFALHLACFVWSTDDRESSPDRRELRDEADRGHLEQARDGVEGAGGEGRREGPAEGRARDG